MTEAIKNPLGMFSLVTILSWFEHGIHGVVEGPYKMGEPIPLRDRLICAQDRFITQRVS